MRNNSIIVQKYGGVCLETPAKIRAVASGLADLHGRGRRIVAIVSAMGKTTDELVQMAYQVSPQPNRRELDMLLTTGERISMSLVSMALSDLGVPATAAKISQSGQYLTYRYMAAACARRWLNQKRLCLDLAHEDNWNSMRCFAFYGTLAHRFRRAHACQAISQELTVDATMRRVKQASKQKRTTKAAAVKGLGAA